MAPKKGGAINSATVKQKTKEVEDSFFGMFLKSNEKQC